MPPEIVADICQSVAGGIMVLPTVGISTITD
jgi:hypothetical protein